MYTFFKYTRFGFKRKKNCNRKSQLCVFRHIVCLICKKNIAVRKDTDKYNNKQSKNLKCNEFCNNSYS